MLFDETHSRNNVVVILVYTTKFVIYKRKTYLEFMKLTYVFTFTN